MEKKTPWGTIVIIIIILVGGYWWWSASKEADTVDDAATEDVVVEATECADDLACGNALLAECKPGSFTAASAGGRQTVKTTVVGSAEEGCSVISALSLDQLAPFADETMDTDGDGFLSMTCPVPAALDFDGLTAHLQGDGLAACEGELKAFYDGLGI